jgi:hypothetical protein
MWMRSGVLWFVSSIGKEKLTRPHLNQLLCVVAHTCQPSYDQKNITAASQSTLVQDKVRHISKLTRAKMAGGVASMLVLLHSSREALSTIPSTAKNKKEEGGRKERRKNERKGGRQQYAITNFTFSVSFFVCKSHVIL